MDRLEPHADRLEVIRIRTAPILPSIKRQTEMRMAFHLAARKDFHTHLAYHAQGPLRLLGLDDFDFCVMQSGEFMASKAWLRLTRHYNVDHLNPISNGGSNTSGNLCFMPAEINNIKSLYHDLQCPRGESNAPPFIQAIIPRRDNSGRIPPVLAIPELSASC